MDPVMEGKISRAGVEAARRKFTPEFMNRIDKLVVFRSLGAGELKSILDLELSLVQQRIFGGGQASAFVFRLTEDAKAFLLSEGTDMKYGARHLKRAIERHLLHPLSNLIASDQIRTGDLIHVDFDAESGTLTFVKMAEDMPPHEMMEMADPFANSRSAAAVAQTEFEYSRAAGARGQRSR